MTTPQQKLTNAYNEFVRDFCERHGECKATRDEAHERADGLVLFAKDAIRFAKKYKISDVDHWIDCSAFYKVNESYLVACAVAAALEETK